MAQLDQQLLVAGDLLGADGPVGIDPGLWHADQYLHRLASAGGDVLGQAGLVLRLVAEPGVEIIPRAAQVREHEVASRRRVLTGEDRRVEQVGDLVAGVEIGYALVADADALVDEAA